MQLVYIIVSLVEERIHNNKWLPLQGIITKHDVLTLTITIACTVAIVTNYQLQIALVFN